MYINNQGTGPFRRCLRSQAARTKTEVWTRHLFEVQRCFHPSRCTTKLGKSIEFQKSNHKIDENSQQSTGVSLNLQSTKIDRSVSYKPPRHRKHLSLFQSISKQNKTKRNRIKYRIQCRIKISNQIRLKNRKQIHSGSGISNPHNNQPGIYSFQKPYRIKKGSYKNNRKDKHNRIE